MKNKSGFLLPYAVFSFTFETVGISQKAKEIINSEIAPDIFQLK